MARTLAAFVIVSAALLAFVGTQALSVAAKPTPVPELKVDFSSMSFQLGTWHCVGHLVGRPGDRKETDVNTMTFDGHWMKTHSVSPPFDVYRKKTVIGDNYLTFDSDNHLWIGWSVDNLGGYGYGTSPGWVGSTLTFTGYALKNGKFVATGTTTMTKVSDAETRSVSMERQKNGTMKQNFSDSCTKTAPM